MGSAGPVTLGVSLTPGGPYTPGSFSLDDPISALGNDTLYLDTDLVPSPSTLLFTYVIGGGTPDDCGVGCMDCATFTVSVFTPPAEPSDQEFCNTDTAKKNLFSLAGLSCLLYDLDYSAGSPTDPDFDTSGTCPDTLGEFYPNLITVGVYSFDFTRKNAAPGCSGCTVNMQVTITEPLSPGANQSGYLCQNN